MSSSAFIRNRNLPKLAVKAVMGYCVSDTVGRIVRNLTDYEELSKTEKLITDVGSYGLGTAAAYGLGIYTDDLIDSMYDAALGEEVPVYDNEHIIIIDEEK